jgi:hypothetical protein
VPKGGLEPPRVSPPPPQDGVSANSTTSALERSHIIEQPCDRLQLLSGAMSRKFYFAGAGAGLEAGAGAGAGCCAFFLAASAFSCSFWICSCEGIATGLLAGAFFDGCVVCCFVVVSRIDLLSLLTLIRDKEKLVTIKIIAATDVIFDRKDAGPRLPKAVCVAPPPKAPAKSALLPDWRRTTSTKIMHTMMCSVITE